MKKIIILFVIISIFGFISCSSTPKRLDTEKDMIADTGELTLLELEKTANRLAKMISTHFKENPNPNGIFIALLPTKNDTSEQLPVTGFDNTLLNELRKNGIFTVRVETREKALAEIQFSQTGLTDKPLSVGKMKSPNFFIRTDITESMYSSSGKKIVEQIINTELISVESQIMVWGDKVAYRKRAVSSGGTGW